MNMKKIFVALMAITMLTASECTSNAGIRKSVNKSRINTLVEELRAEARAEGIDSDRESLTLPGIKLVSENNLDIVSIGSLGISVIKLGTRMSGEDAEEMRMARSLFKGIKKLMIVSYDECPVELRERFNRKVARTLNGCELLIEAKDEGEKVSIYGTSSRDGSKISDIVLFAPDDGALMCFFGTIDAARLGELAASAGKIEGSVKDI